MIPLATTKVRKNNNKIAIIDGTLSKDKVFIKKKKKLSMPDFIQVLLQEIL